MNLIDIAKEAHKNVCPMVNCVDCLFGVCNENCDYQTNFIQELESLIESYEQGNDNK